MNSHTPEPWVTAYSGFHIAAERSDVIALAQFRPGEQNRAKADMKRAVLCVNLLTGVPNELLERLTEGNCTLREWLQDMIETEDRENDIQFVDEIYPEWLIELAGGWENLSVARSTDFNEDHSEKGENN